MGGADSTTPSTPPTAPSPAQIRWRVAAILVLSLILVLAISLEPVHATLLHWLGALRSLMASHPRIAAVAFVGFAALGAMLAFFSTAVLVPAAVGTWGVALTMLLLWLGWMLGGAVMYLIGRALGMVAVRQLVSEGRVAGYLKRIETAAPFSLILLFQLALPSEIPGYVLGLIRYPLPKYLLALALAELPYAIGVAVAGESFLAGRPLPLLAIGVAAAVLAVVAWRTLHRHPALRLDSPT